MGWFAWLFSTRQIFRYWDGVRRRAIDPIAACRALFAHPTYNPETHPALVDLGDDNAREIMLQAGRDVFGVQPFTLEHGGLTEDETLNLMVAFAEYMAGLKKSTNLTLTSPEPTGLPPSVASPTSVASDCGSMSDASKPAAQIVS